MRSKRTHSFGFKGLEQSKNKELVLKSIVKQVQKCTGLSYVELKKKYSEETLFYICLKHCVTTKKALCKAFNINIDNACRYKRSLEKRGLLVQSLNKVFCPYTNHKAHLITANRFEFENLLKRSQY